MSDFFNGFLTAFRLLSRIPAGKKGEADFRYIGFFVPLIGIPISVLNIGLYYGGNLVLRDPFLITLLILIFQYYFFNLFHFDGLLDTADAFAVFTTRERRMEILKDHQTGAFALFFGIVYLALKIYLVYKFLGVLRVFQFSQRDSFVYLLFFFTYPVTGRISSAILPFFIEPASETGLGAIFKNYNRVSAVIGVLLSLGLSVLPVFFGTAVSLRWLLVYLLPFFCALPVSLFTSLLYRKKIGGVTGDGHGLSIELAEAAHQMIFYLFLIYGTGGRLGS